MSANGHTGALAAALVAAQAEMPSVAKTGRSNFGAHVTLDHLINETRKHLAAHNLAVTQFVTVLETGQPALRTILIHESGERIEADQPLFLGEKKTMQELGKAVTYARRYGWSAVLGISTEHDDDADSISQSPPAPDLATKGQKDNIHRLIDKLGKEHGVEESEIREGMQKVYGTQITTKLTKAQAVEFITRLKKAAGEEES